MPKRVIRSRVKVVAAALVIALAIVGVVLLKTFAPEVIPEVIPGIPEEAPPEEAPPEGIVTCPADYCATWVRGAGPCPADIEVNFYGEGRDHPQQYLERECYDYPDTAPTLEECEGLRNILYEICIPQCGNGICVDETIVTCPADCG